MNPPGSARRAFRAASRIAVQRSRKAVQKSNVQPLTMSGAGAADRLERPRPCAGWLRRFPVPLSRLLMAVHASLLVPESLPGNSLGAFPRLSDGARSGQLEV